VRNPLEYNCKALAQRPGALISRTVQILASDRLLVNEFVRPDGNIKANARHARCSVGLSSMLDKLRRRHERIDFVQILLRQATSIRHAEAVSAARLDVTQSSHV
jgi:hypothetical protein